MHGIEAGKNCSDSNAAIGLTNIAEVRETAGKAFLITRILSVVDVFPLS